MPAYRKGRPYITKSHKGADRCMRVQMPRTIPVADPFTPEKLLELLRLSMSLFRVVILNCASWTTEMSHRCKCFTSHAGRSHNDRIRNAKAPDFRSSPRSRPFLGVYGMFA